MKTSRKPIFKKNTFKTHLKYYLSIICILIAITSIIFYEFFSYKILLRDFTSYFDNNKFSKANNLLITYENSNLFKSLFLEKDLTKFFSDKLANVQGLYSKKELSEVEASTIINEIVRYNIIQDDSLNLPTVSSAYYDTALLEYKNKNYGEAYKNFLKIPATDYNYNKSREYLLNCRKLLKEDLISQSEKLSSNHYYTKALNLINKYNDILKNDSDINSLIANIKTQREAYLSQENEKAQAASASIINSITTNNINNLNLESITSFLIYVNLNEQKTYIYKGNKNNWMLEKTFTCSTGTSDEPTPQGVYTVKEKGEWFYSDTYKQGGKYWVQFFEDYLFHSVPFAKDKSTILDETLGKASSHGCIRLSLDDSKWLYSNIVPGTKVIIK